MGDWIRALGIDYGKARIGLAISDDLGLLAHPLETLAAVPPDKARERIVEIVAERGIEDIILGLPLHMDGTEGDAVAGVRTFAEKLKKTASNPELRFHEIDERLTTKTAMEKLHSAGRNEKNSRQIIDQAAAVEILQDWLDQNQNQTPLDIDNLEEEEDW